MRTRLSQSWRRLARRRSAVKGGISAAECGDREGASRGRAGLPGLDPRTIQDFSIDEMTRSPEVVVVLVRLYEELKEEHAAAEKSLEVERGRSRAGAWSTLLLLISQMVTSAGVGIFTRDPAVAIVVITAGVLQAILAVALTFIRRLH
jgi:hypothetical protein